MSEICVFAGTSEGRKLVEYLAGKDIVITVCVATEYGEVLLPHCENISVLSGRLEQNDMQVLFGKHHFDLVVDATHPYAVTVSENISLTCERAGIQYLRLNREESSHNKNAVYVDSLREAADYLVQHSGNALITTGSKELSPFQRQDLDISRLYVRVLPTIVSLEACSRAGFQPSHIVAMQGPFTEEMNAAMLKTVKARFLVTKDSGSSGGFMEKLSAAIKTNVQSIVVGRPKQSQGMSLAEVISALAKRYGIDSCQELSILGMGMGQPDGMTKEVESAIIRSDCLVGSKRMLETVSVYGKPAFEAFKPDDIRDFVDNHPEYERISILMSGDTGFFSGAKGLIEKLKGRQVQVLPGLSSLQVLCSKIHKSWDNVHVLSLHGREGSVVPYLQRYNRVFVLTEGTDAVLNICKDLCRAGMGDTLVFSGERLSYPDERIRHGLAAELTALECAPLTVVLLERPAHAFHMPVGLPDDIFRRMGADTHKRAIPMTKSEVRAVILSKLQLAEDSVVYDIGAGTGSVSVEAALAAWQGSIYAIECREDAVELIESNAETFALRNLTVVKGTAPDALEGLPVPTHAFIGGTNGKLIQIVSHLLALNPSIRIVITAVTLETVGEISGLEERIGLPLEEIVQISVSRSHEAGRYHIMRALDPVYIAVLQNKCADEGKNEDRA